MRFLFVLLLFACSSARADELRLAYLELRQVDAETYQLMWRVPARGGEARLRLNVVLPPGTVDLVEPRAAFVGARHVEHRRIRQPGGLAGRTIEIDGLSDGGAEVLVRVVHDDGTAQVTRLVPMRKQFVVEATVGRLEVVRAYLLLGIQHILLGIDHLLFVFALLMIVNGGSRIVTTVTAFTVAHSITLVAATLGWLNLPPAPVEATIALSIVFLAREVVSAWRRRPSLTRRVPWVVAFVFGLLHGLGFAGALAEIGLPQQAIPLALLCFNVGVEIGQLAFVAVVLALGSALRGVLARRGEWPRWATPYAIGGAASLWMVQRIAAFWA